MTPHSVEEALILSDPYAALKRAEALACAYGLEWEAAIIMGYGNDVAKRMRDGLERAKAAAAAARAQIEAMKS